MRQKKSMQKMKWTVAAALLSPLALAPLAAAYIPGYAVSRGSSAADRPGGHDTDGNGATIMAINVADVKSFDPVARALTCQPVNGQAACGGATDIVLVKTDNGGSGIWTKAFGTKGTDTSNSVASGAQGYYITGLADGQAFIARAALADGKIDLFKVISVADTMPTDVKIHPTSGDVFVAGHTSKGIDGCFAKGTAATEAFLCRYTAELEKQFCVPIGSSAGAVTTMHPGGSIAFDYHGRIYLAGATTGTVNQSTPNLGGRDAWFAQFDTNGNKIFAVNHGTQEDDEATAVAVDPFNDWFFVLGTSTGDLAGQTNHGGRDVFLSRSKDLNSPQLIYTKLYGGPLDDFSADIFAFKERIFIAGHIQSQGNSPWKNDTTYIFYNTATWGGDDMIMCELFQVDDNTLPVKAEDPDLPTGVLKWCSLFGSNGDDASYSIRIDSQYNITVDGAAGGSWGTNTGVVLPFRGGETDQVMQQYFEYEFPIYTPKPLRSEPSPIGPALTCSGGTLATATTTTTATEETLRPTASSSSGFPTPTQSMSSTSSTSSTKSSASLQSNPAGYLVKLSSFCIALLFALFA